MKTFALALATTALTATAAAAAGIGSVDTNGDNFASRAELTAAYPTLTASDFNAIDLNDDRRISNVEITAPAAQVVLGRSVAVEGGVQGLAALDTDGSGFVSEAELVAAYPGLTASDFSDIDANDDNRISALELYGAEAQVIVSRYDAGGSNVLVSLSDVDTDGSGFASLGELAATYRNLSAIDFNEIDTNNDNRVSFDELYDADALVVLGKNL
ncbi:hypothetical protein GQ651_03765 [Alphaproteobacteria bacterium GH1-50]|uniref:EF-hand domain-containing protein n=1 Tax=Kangsaoukella pontilimi TaxID=2691042 RepID=A0A7C9MQ14_9RHOB|nr:EF-hand domain-containing protein [Kangsaoukella pontilimi]MXQ06957.1 hypothetical protein [Kangsaoukella pontilimi]